MSGTASVDIEALEKLARAATQGPWKVQIPDRGYCDNYVVSEHERVKPDEKNRFRNMIANCEECKNGENDANFIAAANPQTILTLISEKRALEQALTEAREALGREIASRRYGPMDASGTYSGKTGSF